MPQATRCRDRAEELRTSAAKIENAKFQDMLLTLAKQYEELAATMEKAAFPIRHRKVS